MLLVYVHKVNFEGGTILTEDLQFYLPPLALGLVTLLGERRLGSPYVLDNVHLLSNLPELEILSNLAIDWDVKDVFQNVR